VSADERALEVDHITPRNKGGRDELPNLQALCFSCNAMKRDRDNTDFRAVRAAYEHRDPECPFCSRGELSVLFEDRLAFVIEDRNPVARGHVLVIPKRHTAEYFDLGTAELRACQQLLTEARKLLLEKHPEVAGFNVGTNSGAVAGQTVMHCHIHLIPRREGDTPNPRGGVRNVIPGKAAYATA
jgi:diadenosine tetraphosphate (Ap4A) HIT family hydrolase